jgi:hypothetical protein
MNNVNSIREMLESAPIRRTRADPCSIQLSTDNRPAILRKLDGDWVATGNVVGKPVQYDVPAKSNSDFAAKHAPLRRRGSENPKNRSMMDARRSMRVRDALWNLPLRTLRLV